VLEGFGASVSGSFEACLHDDEQILTIIAESFKLLEQGGEQNTQ